MLAAITPQSWAFQYASDELKSNKTFIFKALNGNTEAWYLVKYSSITIQSNVDLMTLALEKDLNHGLIWYFFKEELLTNKELAAKALVKFGTKWRSDALGLWEILNPILQEFFPKDCWYEKAQSYLHQLEQEKQSELVSGVVQQKMKWCGKTLPILTQSPLIFSIHSLVHYSLL